MAGGTNLGIPAIARPKAKAIQTIEDQARNQLSEVVERYKAVQGTGQEQGDEADGPRVNERRDAISVLMSGYSASELNAHLPKHKGKVTKRIRADIEWLGRAERQPLKRGKTPDFGWSKNPMSTPKVLKDLAEKRAESAKVAAAEIKADPDRAYDASNDSMLCHLELADSGLRAQVLADTLIQFRAKRRSEALMDSSLVSEEDAQVDQERGRFGTSGTISAFEQRLACQELEKGTSLEKQREYALTRLVVANATSGSVNSIYRSRNTIGLLPDYMGTGAYFDSINEAEGMSTSIFNAIHQNYSANTPRAVDYYLREKIFTGGDYDDRVEVFGALLRAARVETPEAAAQALEDLASEHGYEVPEAADVSSMEALQKAVVEHIEGHCDVSDLKSGLSVEGKLRAYEILLEVHKSVVVDRPTADDLEGELFYAGSAWKDVAAAIHTLRGDDLPSSLAAVGRARTALKKAFFETQSPFERQMMWRLDRKVELISAELLGTAVENVEASDEPQALGEALVAVKSALEGVMASGFDSVRRRKKTAKTESLGALLKSVDALLKSGTTTVEDARALMTQVFQATNEIADTMRGYFHRREGAIRFSELDLDPDPEFSDSLIKETPLHYLLSLSQRGMSFGLKNEITSDEIRFSSGMRVLNSTGPRVYERILRGKDAKALKKYSPPPGPNDLCIITGGHQKDLVYGGGLVLDAKNAGPGYSHASVFAKGHAISAIAMPNLDEAITKFFSKASGNEDGQHPGFYVDDRPGSFVVKPLQSAVKEGLVKDDEIPSLRPGFNLDIEYYDVLGPTGERILKEHAEHRISDHHSLRQIELFVPDLDNKLGFEGPPKFSDLHDTPLDLVRQAAGEKGAVLVQLDKNPVLKKLGCKVPGGSIITPAEVAQLLESASVAGTSLYDHWQSALEDPDFAKPEFRLGDGSSPGRLAQLQKQTKSALRKLLLKGNQPTKQGKTLLAQLAKNPALKGKVPWILRSSFTGEDRPFKSGAGQYDSFPNCMSAKQRLEGVIGVIASAWNEGAVESNLQSGIDLQHVWPSIVAQKCLAPTVSGVAVSRGVHGGFGEVSYQAIPKFGGGVDGGDAEEGVLRKDESSLTNAYKNKDGSLLSEKQQRKLHKAIMAIEDMFNDEIEPGKQFAVDVEWAFEGDTLNILQARVITGV